jgi:pilus assembly protein CpaB
MKSMNRSTIGVTAAVALALVGGLLLWQSSGTDETEAVQAPAEQVQVLVAVRDIDRGTSATDMAENAFAFVRVAEVPADTVLPNALRSVEELADLGLGRNVAVAIIPTEAQITTDSFIVPGSQQRTAIEVAANLFQVTVQLEPQRALGGGANIVPGQTVAVIGSFDPQDEEPGQTVVILDEVEVTNVEQNALLTPEQQARDPLAPALASSSPVIVTLGVEIEDLERLTYAIEFGRIWLADQGTEAVVEGSEVRDRDNVVVAIPEQGLASGADFGE